MFLTLLLAITLSPVGYVNDFASILSPQTVTSLNQELTDFTKNTSAEISVVTIPSLGSDQTIETYATELFQKWGIGKAKEDNGVLLLISRDDREMRIEVGYGLEPVITDIESDHIINDVLVPAFQNGDYDAGVTSAVERIKDDIGRGEPEVGKPTLTFASEVLLHIFNAGGGVILYFIFLIPVFIVSILARSKSWWAGGIFGGVIGWIFLNGIFIIIISALLGLLLDYIVSKTYKKHKALGIDPPWWIGGGGKGPGGGFGGFGGGMSGGGGASGRW
ncbi:TPM domain-containing protein [Candidatus Parcubacteria bacterium]|nr:TPM domain-containing protein [Candidatus Parcubacteria bacterium]